MTRKQNKTKRKAAKKRGPKKGRSYEIDPPVVKVETAPPPAPDPPSVVTECPACKSTRRSGYYSRRRLVHENNIILWRRCKCLACGQIRIDRVSYRQGGEPPVEEGEVQI